MSISLPIFSLLGWLEVNTSLWGEAAGSATAPRLCRHEDAFSLPHIVASLQCGVIENVTAHAVNIADYQMTTIIDCRGVWQYARRSLAETAER